MPFMDNNSWFGSISRVWLWFAFTVPTTSFVFLFYWYHKRQAEKRATEIKEENDAENLKIP
jgi:uncharacterized membrane protein YsdA (DUF1294 family)